MTDRELMSRAKAASMNAYVPYSRFSVGAALECDDGTVFTPQLPPHRHLRRQRKLVHALRRLPPVPRGVLARDGGALRQSGRPLRQLQALRAAAAHLRLLMELEQLRIFTALCEAGGFSAAARRLYKSHSSVSRAVSALERELGVTLCERDRTHFALTAAGERLYAGALELLKEADELEKRVKG